MRLGLFHMASARVDRHQFVQSRPYQSKPWRRLAAAANGPTTRLTSESAHRIENGVPNDSGPDIAACEAATPKISTGIDSGSTSTASSKPAAVECHGERRADHSRERQRRRSDQQRQRHRRGRGGVEIEQQPEHRACHDQRHAGGEPVRQRFRGTGQFQRRPAHHDQVERTVLVVGREQAVEREQAGQAARRARESRVRAASAAPGRARSRTASAPRP